jgi:two-component system alkaline phosphatase synthesis response regulator PhoP
VAEVLIVDDDPDARGMLAFTLVDSGFQVREAKDGEDALEELRAHTPDCILLDLMMPRLDGFKVLEAMRAEHLAVGIPVVVFSCKDEERSFVRVWELGADDYLTKPADPDAVALKVMRLLEAGTPAGRPGA